MEIGIGLPNSIPGVSGATLLAWARRAEERGFAALSTIGRVAFPTYDELIALAAAAGATSRIRLMTNVLLAPTRDPVTLAKEAASLDQLSQGRFTLGIGVGGRPDDFTATGRDLHDRGRRLDAALELMHRAWAGEPVAGSPLPVAPAPVHGGRVPIVFGGSSDAAIRRAARWGIGWTSGSGGPEAVIAARPRVQAAWEAAGREGRPVLAALSYVALGPNADEEARSYLGHYYSFSPRGATMWQHIPRSPQAVRDELARFREAGVDQVFLAPTSGDLATVERIAEAALSD